MGQFLQGGKNGTLKWAHRSNQSVFGIHNIWETTENWENEAISSGLVTRRLYFKKKKDIKRPFFPPCRNWPICIFFYLFYFYDEDDKDVGKPQQTNWCSAQLTSPAKNRKELCSGLVITFRAAPFWNVLFPLWALPKGWRRWQQKPAFSSSPYQLFNFFPCPNGQFFVLGLVRTLIRMVCALFS